MAGFPRCRKKLIYSLSDEIMCINVAQVSKLCGFHIFKCLENKLKYVTAVLNILLLIIDIFFYIFYAILSITQAFLYPLICI